MKGTLSDMSVQKALWMNSNKRQNKSFTHSAGQIHPQALNARLFKMVINLTIIFLISRQLVWPVQRVVFKHPRIRRYQNEEPEKKGFLNG